MPETAGRGEGGIVWSADRAGAFPDLPGSGRPQQGLLHEVGVGMHLGLEGLQGAVLRQQLHPVPAAKEKGGQVARRLL